MLGEQVSMNQALVVTVFSMTVVFLSLLIISFILDIFKITLSDNKEKKNKEVEHASKVDENIQWLEHEEELVAVIMAAISKSMDGFTIKNIVKTSDS